MELPSGKETADLGGEEGKISDGMYVHAVENIYAISDLETLTTPKDPSERLFCIDVFENIYAISDLETLTTPKDPSERLFCIDVFENIYAISDLETLTTPKDPSERLLIAPYYLIYLCFYIQKGYTVVEVNWRLSG